MVRLLLVLAPAVAIVGGIGASYLIRSFTSAIRAALVTQRVEKSKKVKAIWFYKWFRKKKSSFRLISPCWDCCWWFIWFAFTHSTQMQLALRHILRLQLFYVQIVIIIIVKANRDRFGNKHIIDDYREAYYWLRSNTRESDKIMSWWDYGY